MSSKLIVRGINRILGHLHLFCHFGGTDISCNLKSVSDFRSILQPRPLVEAETYFQKSVQDDRRSLSRHQTSMMSDKVGVVDMSLTCEVLRYPQRKLSFIQWVEEFIVQTRIKTRAAKATMNRRVPVVEWVGSG